MKGAIVNASRIPEIMADPSERDSVFLEKIIENRNSVNNALPTATKITMTGTNPNAKYDMAIHGSNAKITSAITRLVLSLFLTKGANIVLSDCIC